jgi:hypothetical protein
VGCPELKHWFFAQPFCENNLLLVTARQAGDQVVSMCQFYLQFFDLGSKKLVCATVLIKPNLLI